MSRSGSFSHKRPGEVASFGSDNEFAGVACGDGFTREKKKAVCMRRPSGAYDLL